MKNTQTRVLLCLLAVVLSCSYASTQLYGVARISPTFIGLLYNVTGFVSFYQPDANSSVTVTVNLTGNLQPRNYGIHVHTFGDLTNPINGSSVASHYVGDGSVNHGCPPDRERHEGDMGNWQATTTGIIQTKILDLLTLTGEFSILGRGVVVHMNQDNCTIPPTGAAGNYIAFGAIGLTSLSSNTAANGAAETTNAVATLSPTLLSPTYCNGLCYGAVYFSESNLITIKGSEFSVQVTAVVYNLANPTAHGIHVHTFGDLSAIDTGASVGSHWNPTGATHALPGVTPRHLGDMGNIQTFDSNGIAYYQNTFPASEFGSLSSIIGRGVVIHALNDKGNGANCDQAGGSGSRILWGVVGLQNATVGNAAIFGAIPSTVSVNNTFVAEPCSPSPSPSANASGPVGNSISSSFNPDSSSSPSPNGGTTGSSYYFNTGAANMLSSWYSLLF